MNDASNNESDLETGFKYNDRVVMLENEYIFITENENVLNRIPLME